MKKLICIICPRGCPLEIDESTLEVRGNSCPRGKIYAESELTQPAGGQDRPDDEGGDPPSACAYRADCNPECSGFRSGYNGVPGSLIFKDFGTPAGIPEKSRTSCKKSGFTANEKERGCSPVPGTHRQNLIIWIWKQQNSEPGQKWI